VKSLMAIVGMIGLGFLLSLALLICLRCFVEARYIAASAMLPTLAAEDRVFIEKPKNYLKRPFDRGEIVVFYPPPSELGGHDLSWDFMHVMGRLTGLPFFPYEAAFVKRVIGLPGERVRIVSGKGVFINGKLLEESGYVYEPADYALNTLGDMGGRGTHGGYIRPFGDSGKENEPIIVPAGQLFVLGDNRNNSEDSHVFGFIDEGRVIGRAELKFFPEVKVLGLPKY
jgi:signal peptidase I